MLRGTKEKKGKRALSRFKTLESTSSSYHYKSMGDRKHSIVLESIRVQSQNHDNTDRIRGLGAGNNTCPRNCHYLFRIQCLDFQEVLKVLRMTPHTLQDGEWKVFC